MLVIKVESGWLVGQLYHSPKFDDKRQRIWRSIYDDYSGDLKKFHN